MQLTLGIDVGGTSIKAVTIASDSSESALIRIPTPKDDPSGAVTIAAISGLVAGFEAEATISGIGVAVPGVVDEKHGVVTRAVNLGWVELPFQRLLESALERPVAFTHDVRAGALAETRAGAARGAASAVFMPVGTGISMASVIDGAVISSGGWAGEIGQVTVTMTPARADLDHLSLESVASASSLARRLGVPNALAVAMLVREGDPRATALWADAIDALAEALAWASAVVAPEVIVIGGGLAQSGDLLVDPLGSALAQRLGVLRCPRVVPAVFGDRAAVVGAGLFARSQFLGGS